MKKLLFFAIAIIGFSATSFAQIGATATASATIKEALTIVPGSNTSIDFGYIIPGGGGTVTVDGNSASARTKMGDDLYLPGGTPKAASFVITGPSSSSFKVTLPGNGVVTVTPESGGGSPMAVNSFSCDLNNSGTSVVGPVASGSLGAGETSKTFYVGATLTVASGQAVGKYNSTAFNVTIAYE